MGNTVNKNGKTQNDLQNYVMDLTAIILEREPMLILKDGSAEKQAKNLAEFILVLTEKLNKQAEA